MSQAFRPPCSGAHRARRCRTGDRRGRNFGPVDPLGAALSGRPSRNGSTAVSFSTPQVPSGCRRGRRAGIRSPRPRGGLARDFLETALRAASRGLATQPSAASLTCAFEWRREELRGVVNVPRIDGMHKVRQSALLAVTRYAGVATRSATVADEVPVDRGAADAEGLGDRRHRVLPTGMHLPSHLKLVDGHD